MKHTATDVLLAALSYPPGAEASALLGQAPPEVWPEVIAHARRHLVAPLLHRRLAEISTQVPASLAAALAQEFNENILHNMLLYQELRRVLGALDAQRIPAITLKGLPLAASTYEHHGMRSILDIDLLVQRGDLLRTERALLALGGRAAEQHRTVGQDNFHFLYILPRSRVAVEVHWTLVSASCPFQIDIAGLWARAELRTLLRAPALTLAPEDLLLHLCVHMAKDWYRVVLRMLCDIHALLRRDGAWLDWASVVARARQWGVGRAAYLCLRLAHDLLAADVPPARLAELRPDGFDERLLALARAQLLDRSAALDDTFLGSPHLAQLWSRRGLRSKLELIRKRVLIPADTLARHYPAPASSARIYLYYPVRAANLLLRFGGAAWRLAHGDTRAHAQAAWTNQATQLRDWMLSA